MSQMFAEIERIVNEDVSNRITQYDVIYEAIINAIHANATSITCSLTSFDNLLQDTESGAEISTPKIDVIKVKDNGDGFNDANYNSFCKYRSKYKMGLGCKGVGRFIFLKVYANAIYKSSLVDEQQVRAFKFFPEFDTDAITKDPAEIKENFTELELSGLTDQYLNADKKIDRRIELDINAIREKVLLHLIPTLFFYKKDKGRDINIEFFDEKSKTSVLISPVDVPEFNNEKFPVTGKDGFDKHFTLYHQIKEESGELHAYYCANNRAVCKFSDKDFNISLPYGYSGFLLLESEYLDTHVNNERNDFDIYPVRTDVFSTISWEQINSALKGIISKIVKAGITDTEKINKEKLEDIQQERPYLIEYIEDADIDMAGFIDKKNIIDKAKKRFDAAKENLLANSGKTSYSEKDLQEAIQITQNELVSYIFDRVQVIERLKTLLSNKEKVESVIHNLFMKKYTEDDYFSVGKNNLWLLDDRFTTYSYAASDKRIKDVLKQIGEDSDNIENGDDKPDLSLFFSHNPLKPERLKSVLIELKPFDYAAKPNRKKFQGVQQLIDYVKAFKSKEKIEEIWAFLITDIDAKFEQRLRDNDFTPLFSTSSPIFYSYFKTLAISIYVVNAETLILDAEARNKIFLDIIRKQNKITKLLKG
ncbi:MAG TPA: hypothetical protein VHA52_03570 [Candidatus Babeliaceae bacterium]|nr:hypothetical protein [Candidatus Babeliaceae bacterium]